MVKLVPPSPFLGRKALAFAAPLTRFALAKGGTTVIDAKPHKWGCLLLPLPAELAKEVTNWLIEQVPDEDLGPGGRELRPHVTALYGFAPLDPNQLNELKAYLLRNGPITLSLGHEPSLFTKNEDGDVLILDVDSPALEGLHYDLEKTFGAPGNKHPEYKPHLTLAYLKPEASARYLRGAPTFAGREVVCDWAEYGAADGSKTTLPLAAATGLWGGKAFCPTGEGGGIDPTCSPGGSGKTHEDLKPRFRNANEFDKWVDKNYRQWWSSLPREQQTAVEHYHHSKFQAIQSFVRGDGQYERTLDQDTDPDDSELMDEYHNQIPKIVEALDQAFSDAPRLERPTAVERSISGWASDFGKQLEEALKGGTLKPGSMIEDSGYQSTYRRLENRIPEGSHGRILLLFNVPAGTPVIPRGVYQEGHGELTLPRGARFTVNQVEIGDDGKSYTLHLTYEQADVQQATVITTPPVRRNDASPTSGQEGYWAEGQGSKAMSWQHETAGGALAEPPEQRGPEGEYCPHCDARLERSEDGVCNRCGKPWPETKGLGTTVQSAGKWLAGKWEQLEQRYGRRAALGMAVAMLATLPVPGNIAAVVAAAEAVRGLHGYWQQSRGGGSCEPGQTAAQTDCTPAKRMIPPSPFVGRKALTIPYLGKAQGQPCESGETAKQTGCIPASGEGGKGSGPSRASEAIRRKLPTPDKWKAALLRAWEAGEFDVRDDPSEPMPDGLEAMCMEASHMLRDVLAKQGIATRVVTGQYAVGGKRKQFSAEGTHFWLETTDGTIIDGTERQFDPSVGLGQINVYPQDHERHGWYTNPDPVTELSEPSPSKQQPGKTKLPKVSPENYAELNQQMEQLGGKLDSEEISDPNEQRYYQKLEAALTAHEAKREREFEKQVDKWTKKHEELTEQRGEAESRLDDERFAEHTRRAEASQADAEAKQEQAAQLEEQFATQAQAARQALEGIARPQQYEGGDDVLGSFADAFDSALEDAAADLEDPEAGPEEFAKTAERLEKLARRASTYLTETPEDAQAVASLSRSAGAARQALLAAAGKLQPLREELRRATWAAEAADTAYTGALTAGYDSPDFDPPGSPALAEVQRLEEALAEHAKLEPDYERDLPELWADQQRRVTRQSGQTP